LQLPLDRETRAVSVGFAFCRAGPMNAEEQKAKSTICSNVEWMDNRMIPGEQAEPLWWSAVACGGACSVARGGGYGGWRVAV